MGRSEAENVRKLKHLTTELKEKCSQRQKPIVVGLTLTFDNDNGRTVQFVRDMPLSSTGSLRDSYDANSPYFKKENSDTQWPYTGYVEGNVISWRPISAEELVGWVDRSGYDVDDLCEKLRYEMDR